MGAGGKPLRRSRAAMAARASVLVGAIGAVLSAQGLVSAGAPQLASLEHTALLASGILSVWATVAALRLERAAGASSILPMRAPGSSALPWETSTVMALVRSLLSGCTVGLLGWSLLLGESRHVMLMGAMQANSAVGGWLACEMQRVETRAKQSEPPTAPDDAARRMSAGGGTRRYSLTLPRGWRYHKSTGLFEHKRTGRMQYEPPGTSDTGSPLCNLPPCDEERALLECSDGTSDRSDRESGCEGGMRAWRSRTWHDSSSSRRESKQRRNAAAHHDAPMSVWELREALQWSGGSGGGGGGAGSGAERDVHSHAPSSRRGAHSRQHHH